MLLKMMWIKGRQVGAPSKLSVHRENTYSIGAAARAAWAEHCRRRVRVRDLGCRDLLAKGVLLKCACCWKRVSKLQHASRWGRSFRSTMPAVPLKCQGPALQAWVDVGSGRAVQHVYKRQGAVLQQPSRCSAHSTRPGRSALTRPEPGAIWLRPENRDQTANSKLLFSFPLFYIIVGMLYEGSVSWHPHWKHQWFNLASIWAYAAFLWLEKKGNGTLL